MGDMIDRDAVAKAIAALSQEFLDGGSPTAVKVLNLAMDRVNALPAAPAEDVRAANRVTYNDDGTLDEIVTDAGVHLEALGGNRWFLGAARSDGTEIRVWIRGKVTLIEDDAKEAKP